MKPTHPMTPPPDTAAAPAGTRGDRLDPPRSHRSYAVLTGLRDGYARAIREHLGGADGGPRRVLDFGCGDRPYRPLFETCFDTHGGEYVGADLPGNDAADLTIAPDGRVPAGDGAFDVVLSAQVLEHVADPGGYLREARRLLKPGGTLLLSTHGVWRYHPDPRDLWRWTSEGLRWVLTRAGFRVVEQTGILGPEAAALQLWQDAVVGRVPGRLRPAFHRSVQHRIARADRRCPPAVRDRDACVYLAVAVRDGA